MNEPKRPEKKKEIIGQPEIIGWNECCLEWERYIYKLNIITYNLYDKVESIADRINKLISVKEALQKRKEELIKEETDKILNKLGAISYLFEDREER